MSSSVATRSRPRSSPPIDPRLRERRIEVARDNGRRRLRRFAVLVAVALVVAGAVALSRSPMLDVDHVEVRGTTTAGGSASLDAAAVAAIRRAAAIDPRQPMLTLDTGAVRQAVGALPTVERVQVARRWPSTVRIVVTERRPVAVVGSGSAAVIVDRSGTAIAPAADTARPAASGLPVLSGDPVAVGARITPPRRTALAVMADLPPTLRSQVARARVTPTGVVLDLDDDIEVRWGDSTQATAKAEALGVLLEQADRSTIATVDVSVPRASTLTRKNGGK